MTASDQQRIIAWNPVPGASLVEVSTEGLVWSHRTQRLLAQTPNNKGYLRVRYVNDAGKRVTRLVHVLVLEAFVGPRPVDHRGRPMECCHGPGGKTDNRWPENIRWDTAEANRRDRYGERRRRLGWPGPLGVTLRSALMRARRRYGE